MEISYISKYVHPTRQLFFLPNKPLRTQKFGLGISFSASLSAFPSSRAIQGSLLWLDPLFDLRNSRFDRVFLDLGGIAFAGTHDAVGKVVVNFVG